MSIHRYMIYNAAMPTTAPLQVMTTGTATKTLLQLATPSTRMVTVISWGIALSSVSAGDQFELIETDVAASGLTAHVAAGIMPLLPQAPASQLVLGTAATGYGATTENTPTAVRVFDAQVLAAASSNELNYSYQFLPDERPVVNISKFLRVRVNTSSGAKNALAWVCFEE